MDVVDSPLNQAHQQGRRADTFLKKEKFEEAIVCHKKAADLLLAAMRTTHTQGALQSLTLQREYHLKQEAVIRQKQRHLIIAQKKSKKSRPTNGYLDQPDGVPSCVHNPDSDVRIAAQIANQLTDNIERAPEGTLVHRTMEQCDSLLQMLDLRSRDEAGDVAVCELRDAARPLTNGAKSPKDDKVVIEELRVHNIALCGHIVDLLKEIELHQRQIQLLRCEKDQLVESVQCVQSSYMQDSTDSEKYYPVPVGMNLHDLPSLELPPLEMPKFDFSALKIDSEEPQE